MDAVVHRPRKVEEEGGKPDLLPHPHRATQTDA
jgi:hypothetical protein